MRKDIYMLTLFVIGLMVLCMKLVFIACKLAWGLFKGLVTLAWLPIALTVLVMAGLIKLALPLLLIALALALVFPAGKRAC